MTHIDQILNTHPVSKRTDVKKEEAAKDEFADVYAKVQDNEPSKQNNTSPSVKKVTKEGESSTKQPESTSPLVNQNESNTTETSRVNSEQESEDDKTVDKKALLEAQPDSHTEVDDESIVEQPVNDIFLSKSADNVWHFSPPVDDNKHKQEKPSDATSPNALLEQLNTNAKAKLQVVLSDDKVTPEGSEAVIDKPTQVDVKQVSETSDVASKVDNAVNELNLKDTTSAAVDNSLKQTKVASALETALTPVQPVKSEITESALTLHHETKINSATIAQNAVSQPTQAPQTAQALADEISTMSAEELVALEEVLTPIAKGEVTTPMMSKAQAQSLLDKTLAQQTRINDKVEIAQTTLDESLDLESTQPKAAPDGRVNMPPATPLTDKVTQSKHGVSETVVAATDAEVDESLVDDAVNEQINLVQKSEQSAHAQQSHLTKGLFTSPIANNFINQLSTQPTQSQDFDLMVQAYQNQTGSTALNNTGGLTAEQILQQPVNINRHDAVKALFDKANILLNMNKQEAEIRLDPPELGSMQIRVRSDAEQAQINFVVQSQQAKEVLEQSMGRLKEMLAEQGINLGESSVEQGDSGQQSEQENGTPFAQNGEMEDESVVSAQFVSKQASGIDFYA